MIFIFFHSPSFNHSIIVKTFFTTLEIILSEVEENKKIKDVRLEELLQQAAKDPQQLESLVTYFLLKVIANDPKSLQHYTDEVLEVLDHWTGEHPVARAFKYFVTG